jgi:hypothetical protein
MERVAIASFVAVVAYDKQGRPLGGSEVLETMSGAGTGMFPDVDGLWWEDQRRRLQGAGFAFVRSFPSSTALRT